MADTLSTRSLARVLSDIAGVFSSGDQPQERLVRVVELLRDLVPYSECALLTLQPHEVYLALPRGAADAGLRVIVADMLADLRQAEQPADRAWPQCNAHLAVPLVNPDVQVVGLLLLVQHSGTYDDTDLRVLATVAGQLASYVTWLQFRQERTALLAGERAARNEADRANRAKDEFLATLSHELRSPLNAIVGWSDMLLRGKLPPDTVQRALQAIHRNARNQAHLIDDVLDVSRIISGRLLIEKQRIDACAVIHGAVEALRPAADERNVDLVCYVPDTPIMLAGDANRLQQVFANLLSNAVKFTPDGGHVRVSTAMSGDLVHVQVQDNGVGIDSAALPHVFDRFYQQDSSSTRRHAGLGLGLAIAKHIVEQHGGRIRVESAGQGKGATFTVTLHADVSASALAPSEHEPVDTGSLHGLAILVVDDDAETRELVRTLLAEHGASVQLASGADAAINCISRARPDLVVTDIAMPDKDGLAMIRELADRDLRVPAIALTAHGRGDASAQAIEAGFDMYLAKPILPRELVMAVALLARRSGGKK